MNPPNDPNATPTDSLRQRFERCFGQQPSVCRSAPGRLEVLGNHTDYNAGLTLSCAVAQRCHAAIAPIDEPEIRLASTAYDQPPRAIPLNPSRVAQGDWANYILGLVAALREQGHNVPGFALLVDSQVPVSAGLSSSAALGMAVLLALTDHLGVEATPIDLARIGQRAESQAVGAHTGLLDPLTSLLGRREHLLHIDFQTLAMRWAALPTGWCFVAIDSGVKHDLTRQYNDRRAACAAAAAAMGIGTLREANLQRLAAHRDKMPNEALRCATHIVNENARVQQARRAMELVDPAGLGSLMFESHESSRLQFRNSCDELDELVEHARQDPRCLGARLSGGGFGGISIHLVHQQDAEAYRTDAINTLKTSGSTPRWSAICAASNGAFHADD